MLCQFGTAENLEGAGSEGEQEEQTSDDGRGLWHDGNPIKDGAS